jgi:hypothetical protein
MSLKLKGLTEAGKKAAPFMKKHAGHLEAWILFYEASKTSEAVDWDSQDFRSLAIGFFIGRGMSIEDAAQLARLLVLTEYY